MATVTLIERNGAGSGVDTSDPVNINFGSVDQSGLDPTDHPIPIVTSGESRSFEKYFRLAVHLKNLHK